MNHARNGRVSRGKDSQLEQEAVLQLNMMQSGQLRGEKGVKKLFTLAGWIEGKKAQILIDSGASANFVSSRFVDTESIKPCDATVRLANGQEALVKGQTVLHLQMEQYNTTCNFKIFDMEQNVILGQTWLTQVNPFID